jgi:lipopolysaccharide export LptBFGC system permease protein LptF
LDLGAADHLVEFHKRIALSTVNLIFGLLGAGLGMLSRKASRILGFAAALLLSFGVYYPLLVLGIWMAKEGLVPPWLGLWIPNLLFAAGGCALCRTVIRP